MSDLLWGGLIGMWIGGGVGAWAAYAFYKPEIRYLIADNVALRHNTLVIKTLEDVCLAKMAVEDIPAKRIEELRENVI